MWISSANISMKEVQDSAQSFGIQVNDLLIAATNTALMKTLSLAKGEDLKINLPVSTWMPQTDPNKFQPKCKVANVHKSL